MSVLRHCGAQQWRSTDGEASAFRQPRARQPRVISDEMGHWR